MLSELVAVLPLEGIGVVGILLIIGFMLSRGNLVLGKQHDEQMREKDERNASTEAALLKSLDLNQAQAGTIAKQTAVSDVAAHLLEELRREAAEKNQP